MLLPYDADSGKWLEEPVDAMLERLRREIVRSEAIVAEDPGQWNKQMLQWLDMAEKLHSGMDNLRWFILVLYEKHWKELPDAFRKEYGYEFSIFTYKLTGLLWSTVDKRLRTAQRVFLEKPPVEYVRVPQRDAGGNIVRDPRSGDEQIETLSWQQVALRTPISKLDAIVPHIGKRTISKELWTMVADRGVTVDALKSEIYKPPVASGDPDPLLSFALAGNILTASRNGEIAEIGELYFDMGMISDVAKAAVYALLAALNIQIDEDVLQKYMAEQWKSQVLRLNDIYQGSPEDLEAAAERAHEAIIDED